MTLSNATLPNPCPPISPPVLINPHEHRVIDTGHRDLVRVYVLGSSGFDVTTINPATVELNGAKPIAHLTRHFPHSEFLNATYVFVGSDINLPAGSTTATFTAQTFSGQQITSSQQVLNIPFSAKVPGRLNFLMDKGTAYPALRRLESTQPAKVSLDNTTRALPATVKVDMASRTAARGMKVSYRPQVSASGTTTPVAMPRTVVSLKASAHAGSGAGQGGNTLPQARPEPEPVPQRERGFGRLIVTGRDDTGDQCMLRGRWLDRSPGFRPRGAGSGSRSRGRSGAGEPGAYRVSVAWGRQPGDDRFTTAMGAGNRPR